MTDQSRNSPPDNNAYDVMPYPSHPFRQTHPDRLATIGLLFGLQPAAPDTCRVLEIGCASGGNLIPMASNLPQSQFLGIDLSIRQIEEGQETLADLGLDNVELRQMDVVDLSDDLGPFDYIICHGVYSWVSDATRAAILRHCRSLLAPQGVAYISYNTYPGWHFRGMIRDMMCFHVRNLNDASKRVQQSRALLEFLAQSVPTESSAYGMLLKSELDLLRKQSDAYLFHEHLESHNAPLYFYQFVEHVHTSGMQYLGDTQMATMWLGNFPSEVAETLERITPGIQQREQYTDFLRNRTFRQSLICHQNVTLSRDLSGESIKSCRVAGCLKPGKQHENADWTSNRPLAFKTATSGQEMTTSDPVLKVAARVMLDAWPGSIDLDDLFDMVIAKLLAASLQDAARIETLRRTLATNLLKMHVSGLVELHVLSDTFVTDVNERPKMSALARLQATKSNRLVNQRHELVAVNDLTRHLVPAVDGTRDRASLCATVRQLIDDGTLAIQTPEGQDLSAIVAKAVEETLGTLARSALLVE